MIKGGKQEVKEADHDDTPRGAFILSNRPSDYRCPLFVRTTAKLGPGVKAKNGRKTAD